MVHMHNNTPFKHAESYLSGYSFRNKRIVRIRFCVSGRYQTYGLNLSSLQQIIMETVTIELELAHSSLKSISNGTRTSKSMLGAIELYGDGFRTITQGLVSPDPRHTCELDRPYASIRRAIRYIGG